jgi:hypothetical protein
MLIRARRPWPNDERRCCGRQRAVDRRGPLGLYAVRADRVGPLPVRFRAPSPTNYPTTSHPTIGLLLLRPTGLVLLHP